MKEMGKHVDAVVIITNQICGMDEVSQLDSWIEILVPLLQCIMYNVMYARDLWFAQSDSVWLANVKKLMQMTGDLPLGLYETPVPQVR